MPPIIALSQAVTPATNAHELDRFLDVYDVRESELEFAVGGSPDAGVRGDESIKHLRKQQQQLSILRRYSLCCLLSLPAASSRGDLPRWRMVTQATQVLTDALDGLNRRLCDTLREDEGKLWSCQGLPTFPDGMVLIMSRSRCARESATNGLCCVNQ